MSGEIVPYVPGGHAPQRRAHPQPMRRLIVEQDTELDAMRRALDEQHPELIAFTEAIEADVRRLAERRRQLDQLGPW